MDSVTTQAIQYVYKTAQEASSSVEQATKCVTELATRPLLTTVQTVP